MFHVLRVQLALRAAHLARGDTRLQLPAQDYSVDGSLARCEASSDVANIGAIEVQADAPDKLRDILLGQARVGTTGAGLSTVETGLHTMRECLWVNGSWLRMRTEHGLGMLHLALLRFTWYWPGGRTVPFQCPS